MQEGTVAGTTTRDTEPTVPSTPLPQQRSTSSQLRARSGSTVVVVPQPSQRLSPPVDEARISHPATQVAPGQPP